ncbi:MAG: hypothetical protein AAB655_02590 [Patescibacteria group bacterium]
MSQILQLTDGVFGGLWKSIADVWSELWWIFLPVIAFFIFWDFWVLYIQFRFISSIKWDLLEIKVPKDILKTPKAMEQIFAAAHAPYSYGLTFKDKYWDGRVEYWMSFELFGSAGESHFYLRLPKQFRNLMESAIYGQYPGAEIIEAEDYVKQVSKIVPNETFELFGNEQILRAPSCYPIRTYPMFEESVEERRVDTIAPVIETMSKLKSDEQIWIQILTRPTGDDWKKEGEAMANTIMGIKDEKKKSSWFPGFGLTLGEIFRAPFEHPNTEVEKPKDDFRLKLLMLTPGQKEVVEGIERKISKLGFETTIRFVYIDKRDAFSRDNVASMQGYFRQFNTQNMNLLRPDKDTMTASVRGLFTERRLAWRKRLIFEKYRDMIFNSRKSILNIEELATIYHLPITGVETTYLKRIESRKGSPPPTLPVL